MPMTHTLRPNSRGPRFGGFETPAGYLFELTGGRLCLDLANTLDERLRDQPRELLRGYKDALDWSFQAGALSGSERRALLRRAEANLAEATTALDRLRRGREAIFAVFSAVALRKAVPATTLDVLNGLLRTALTKRQLAGTAVPLEWKWRHTGTPDLDRPLWVAFWSAMELLTSGDVARVRQCQGTGCAWLFMDTSRNGTRRWCDMSVCGNRAKARRFRSRSSTTGSD